MIKMHNLLNKSCYMYQDCNQKGILAKKLRLQRKTKNSLKIIRYLNLLGIINIAKNCSSTRNSYQDSVLIKISYHLRSSQVLSAVISVFNETGIFSETSLSIHRYQYFWTWGHVSGTFWISHGIRVKSSLFQRTWPRCGLRTKLVRTQLKPTYAHVVNAKMF